MKKANYQTPKVDIVEVGMIVPLAASGQWNDNDQGTPDVNWQIDNLFDFGSLL